MGRTGAVKGSPRESPGAPRRCPMRPEGYLGASRVARQAQYGSAWDVTLLDPQRRRNATTAARLAPPRKGEVYLGSAQYVTPLDPKGAGKRRQLRADQRPMHPRSAREERTRETRGSDEGSGRRGERRERKEGRKREERTGGETCAMFKTRTQRRRLGGGNSRAARSCCRRPWACEASTARWPWLCNSMDARFCLQNYMNVRFCVSISRCAPAAEATCL